LLALSTFGTAIALVGTGLAPAFWVTIAVGVLHGFCSGAIDASLNSHAARTFTPTAINIMHACYGIGAALSPLLITAVLLAGAAWRWAYLIIAAVQAGLGLLFLIAAPRWPAPGSVPAPAPPTGAAPRRLGPAVLGVVAVLVQSAFESSLGLWCFVFLTGAVGLPPETAAVTVSGYWAALCVTRLLIGPVVDRLGPWPVMTGAAGGLVIFAALLLPADGRLAIIAVIGLGVAAAPLYPLLMLTTGDRAGRIDRVVGLQTAASALGAAILPGLIGVIMDREPHGYAPIMVALSVLVLTLQLVIRWALRRRRGLSPTPTCQK